MIGSQSRSSDAGSRRCLIQSRLGFTLIELLVVVAIIGILAAIAMPKLFGALCSSKVGRVDGVFGSINSAMALYYSESNHTLPIAASAVNVSTFLVPNYMTSTPESPWSAPYYYVGDGSSYTLCVAVDGGKGCDGSSSTGTDNYRFYSAPAGRVGQSSGNPC